MKKFIAFIIFCYISFWFVFASNYTDEQKSAYTWAFNNWITTQSTIDNANMFWYISRIELAKMISNYAINNLKKTKNTFSDCVYSDISVELDKKYDHWVTNACKLWIMWLWIDKFRPYDRVTKAEFCTILSRLLYWNAYDWWYPYYSKHLKKLNYEWIVSDISDADIRDESRWNVMIMLKRSFDWGNGKITLDAYEAWWFNIVYWLDTPKRQNFFWTNNLFVSEKYGFIMKMDSYLDWWYLLYKTWDSVDWFYFYEDVEDEWSNSLFTIFVTKNLDNDIKCEAQNNKYCFVFWFNKWFDVKSYTKNFAVFDI